LKRIYSKFLWFELATVTSQALKYDVMTYTPYEGLNYTILDKTTSGTPERRQGRGGIKKVDGNANL